MNRTKFALAVRDQARAELEAEVRAGRKFPEPSLITVALDAKALYGPKVDEACLAREPAVDNWEMGASAPTWEQLCALADLTGMLPEFFFQEPVSGFDGFICGEDECSPIEPRDHPVPRFDPDHRLAVVIPLSLRRR